jgi:hypothetical protein
MLALSNVHLFVWSRLLPSEFTLQLPPDDNLGDVVDDAGYRVYQVDMAHVKGKDNMSRSKSQSQIGHESHTHGQLYTGSDRVDVKSGNISLTIDLIVSTRW